jgi:hypothetical protein
MSRPDSEQRLDFVDSFLDGLQVEIWAGLGQIRMDLSHVEQVNLPLLILTLVDENGSQQKTEQS